jgi:chromate reductase, NAD(P)H dehydrogenase (quinone)
MDSGTTAAEPVRVFEVVGLVGSLRRGSFNRALLQAAVESAPPALHITTREIGDLPLYSADIEAALPKTVSELRNSVGRSDGLLIATPEYNHGVPGVLKNAIDWLSRPPKASALNGKVAAIMGASRGMTGTARSQSQLRQAFVFTNTYALLQPEVLVARAHEKFDANGKLTDEPTREFLEVFLDSFVALMVRLAAPRHSVSISN